MGDRVTAAITLAVALFTFVGAKAEIIQLTCGKTGLTIDTAAPSVVIHYNNGFSETYKNSTRTSSYQFLDGTENRYTSDVSVTVTEREVVFVNRYQSAAGLNVIRNVINRKTGIWRSDQNGKIADTLCVR
jgi:hypothetical protein